MSYVIEGDHGLALHPGDNLKYAAVVEPSGAIWTTDGKNSHWWWRTKSVIHTPTDGGEETVRTTKLPASAERAARRYAQRVAPEDAVVGEISETGGASVFTPVETGEVVQVTRRWTRNTRRANLLRPEETRRGTVKLRKKESHRIDTSQVLLWNDKNWEALRQAAKSIMRNVEGRVIFAR